MGSYCKSTNNINNQPSYLVFLQNNYTIFTFIQSFLSFFFIILVLDCPAWLFYWVTITEQNYGIFRLSPRGIFLDVLIGSFCCPLSRSFEVLHIGSFDLPSCFRYLLTRSHAEIKICITRSAMVR